MFSIRYITEEETNRMVEGFGTISLNIKKKVGNNREWKLQNFYRDVYASYSQPEENGPLYPIRRPFIFRCLKCKANFTIDKCYNCDHTEFKGDYQIFCANCDKSFSVWVCSKCGCENPTSKTLYLIGQKISSGCFIATAVCGSESDPDVIALKYLKDRVFLSSRVGQLVVGLYYIISPPVARILSTNLFLRKIIHGVFIHPIANICRSRFYKGWDEE